MHDELRKQKATKRSVRQLLCNGCVLAFIIDETMIEWVEYASCKVAHKCLREWKCINKNAYICLRDRKRWQNPLICAYSKKMLTKSAYICLSKNLLTKSAYQNVLIEEFACICLKTSFYAEIFSTVKSVASRPRWRLSFCLELLFSKLFGLIEPASECKMLALGSFSSFQPL